MENELHSACLPAGRQAFRVVRVFCGQNVRGISIGWPASGGSRPRRAGHSGVDSFEQAPSDDPRGVRRFEMRISGGQTATPTPPASRLLDLQSGTWHREKLTMTVYFDLPKGTPALETGMRGNG